MILSFSLSVKSHVGTQCQIAFLKRLISVYTLEASPLEPNETCMYINASICDFTKGYVQILIYS